MPQPEPEPRTELQPSIEQGAVLAPSAVGRARPAGVSRGLILAAIEEAPGLGFNELAQRTELARGTLAHHLPALQRHGLVWTMRHGDQMLHFRGPRPDEDGVRRLLEAHALDELDRDLLAVVREASQSQKATVAHFKEVARSTVQKRLRRLVEWGFLAVRTDGRCKVYEVDGAASAGTQVKASEAAPNGENSATDRLEDLMSDGYSRKTVISQIR